MPGPLRGGHKGSHLRIALPLRGAVEGSLRGIAAPLVLLAGGWRSSAAVAALGGLLLYAIWRLHRDRSKALRDLHHCQQAQRDLLEAETRFRSVFDAATDGLLVLDDKGRVREANPAACMMLGFPEGRLAGVDVRTLIPADQIHIFDLFRRQLRRSHRVRLDARAVSRDGVPFDVEIRGSAYAVAGERRVLAILTDVTERKAAERRLAQLSRTVLRAQETERARVARDLHDELGQIITALRLELGILIKRPPDSAEETAEGIRGITELVEHAATELRRVCQGLRPPLLDDLGLGPAVEQMIARFEEHSDLLVHLDLRLPEPKPAVRPELALCTFRILQEALTNVSRHAQAHDVSVSLSLDGDTLRLSVYDDGRGFDPAVGGNRGAGITGMRERAHLAGGLLSLRSAPDEGSRVTFEAPAYPVVEPPLKPHQEPSNDPHPRRG